jgi:hypothetical protein
MGKPAWTKRDKATGEFMDVKKSRKKFKGVRREGLKKTKSKKKRL